MEDDIDHRRKLQYEQNIEDLFILTETDTTETSGKKSDMVSKPGSLRPKKVGQQILPDFLGWPTHSIP